MSTVERDAGHALVETMLLGLVFLVPIIWMLTVFAELHSAALMTSSAVRESGFESARSVDVVGADRAIGTSVSAAVADHGLDPSRVSIEWSPPAGWGRGDEIEIVVTYEVPVIQAPLLGAVTDPSIQVTARHIATIDRYRSRPE